MDPDEILRAAISDEMEAEMQRQRESSFGTCRICGENVTEWDLTSGPYGAKFHATDGVAHSVCLSGKLAVAG